MKYALYDTNLSKVVRVIPEEPIRYRGDNIQVIPVPDLEDLMLGMNVYNENGYYATITRETDMFFYLMKPCGREGMFTKTSFLNLFRECKLRLFEEKLEEEDNNGEGNLQT